MLALAKTKPERGGVELVDGLPVPEPGRGEIRLRVGAAGICGTDLHVYHWVPWAAARVSIPTILGHEVAGTVDSVGEGVTHLSPGDLVSVESHLSCGTCRPCKSDNAHVCVSTHYPGIDMSGGFAEWLTIPARIAWKQPAGTSIETAAMFEPFGIAVHAATEGSGVAGRQVLVSGCGPIGLMCVVAARALGAARIVATDTNPRRLREASSLGADRVVDVGREDPAAVSRAESNGQGVDVVLECAGHPSAVESGAAALVPGGELRLVGVPAEPVALDLSTWILKGIVVRAIHGRRLFATWEQTSRLVASGKVDLARLVSHRLALADGLRAFDLLERGEALKVLLFPDRDRGVSA